MRTYNQTQGLYVLLLVVALCLLAVLVYPIVSTPATTTPYHRRLEGCLAWCHSHGAHESPEEYLDCAMRCEMRVEEIAHAR